MNRAGDWQKPVQCLYCEAELKNFRSLFDEDFCSREHRENCCANNDRDDANWFHEWTWANGAPLSNLA